LYRRINVPFPSWTELPIPRVSTSLVLQYEEDGYHKDSFYHQRHVSLWFLVMKTVSFIEDCILRVWSIWQATGFSAPIKEFDSNSRPFVFFLCSTVSSPWCACGSPFLELSPPFLRRHFVSDLDRICKTSTRFAVDNKLRLRL
jgi:hypothetical protein